MIKLPTELRGQFGRSQEKFYIALNKESSKNRGAMRLIEEPHVWIKLIALLGIISTHASCSRICKMQNRSFAYGVHIFWGGLGLHSVFEKAASHDVHNVFPHHILRVKIPSNVWSKEDHFRFSGMIHYHTVKKIVFADADFRKILYFILYVFIFLIFSDRKSN